ncbi:MAG: gliding motility-associated C-terminal domain-containing protein, partial [Bacteroidetes bacterium]|nr:gliding motility-associated C-terminal domain-containing protein [Bacteroidota bacterium]
YRVVVKSGVCSSANSNAATINVDPITVGGSTGSAAVYCTTINSGAINLSGYTGTIQGWESSTDNFATHTSIAGTSANLNYNNVSQNTKYRALVKSGTCSSEYSTPTLITVDVSLKIDLGADTTLCFAGNEIWKGIVADTFASILWSTGSTAANIEISEPSQVWVTVTNKNSCEATANINITEYCKPVSLCFPDVITPNGDGINDAFMPCEGDYIEITNDNYSKVVNNVNFEYFEVLDRWGVSVFKSAAVMPNWDAKYQGAMVPDGTYFWIVKYSDTSNAQYEQNGYLTVLGK